MKCTGSFLDQKLYVITAYIPEQSGGRLFLLLINKLIRIVYSTQSK